MAPLNKTIRSAALALMGFACLAAYANSNAAVDFVNDPGNPSVVTVDGCPVHLDEFSWFMQQERAAVFRAVTADFSLNSETNFWEQDCNGITPREILLDKTVEKVVQEKTKQLHFKELGLVDDIQHSAFLENLEKLNAQRKKDVAAGKVIYGPVQYSPRQYYSHWMATTKIKAKNQFRNDLPAPDEAQLRDYYNQRKQQFKSAASWTVEILAVKGLDGTRPQGRGITSVAADIMLNVRQERALEDISEDYKDCEETQVTYSYLEKMAEDRLGEWFMDESLSLTPGQVLQVPLSKEEIWIVKVISFSPSDYVPFEQIRDRLVPGFEDEAYDRMIQKRIKAAHIEINHKAIAGIKTL